MTTPPPHVGVILILFNPTGQIVASADDFQTSIDGHDHLQAAQEARAYRSLCTRVVDALANPSLAKAIDPAAYRTIVDTMVRRDKHHLLTHYVGQSAPVEGQHF